MSKLLQSGNCNRLGINYWLFLHNPELYSHAPVNTHRQDVIVIIIVIIIIIIITIMIIVIIITTIVAIYTYNVNVQIKMQAVRMNKISLYKP